MKNSILLLVISMMFVFSCASDDDSSPTIDESLIYGKWQPIKSESYLNGVLIDTEQETYNPECPEYWQFNSDYTGAEYYFNSTNCNLEYEDSFTWSLNGNYLSSEFGDSYLIETINSSELILSDTENDLGTQYSYKMYFEKLD